MMTLIWIRIHFPCLGNACLIRLPVSRLSARLARQDMSYWLVLSPFWAADLYALLSGLYVLGCCIRFRPTSQEEKRNLVR